MNIKFKKLKRSRSRCEADSRHGKTYYKLTIDTGWHYYEIWLCASCLAEFYEKFKNSFTEIAKEIYGIE